MQVKQCLNLAAISALSILITGCASIVTGTSQKIKITSVPDAADVNIQKLTLQQNVIQFEGKTPMTASLSRKGTYLVTISSAGYQKAEIPIESGGMNGWVWGNIGFGGLVGLIIDTADGAAIMLKPEKIEANLVTLPPVQQTAADRRDVTASPAANAAPDSTKTAAGK